ncbi:GntR family transcriptional regulator [Undibacterium sp. TS12]|uniref:GntR family transcriptional regulator n=1 Tax=Undibacterium sp. TS12 TaxID=2908202 RepID=UPI001F4CA5B5|nr:GntR family transcriptional regulator [Undibacterium sp. TS12]MCH8619534.1 GntR family transcriptional regulator [Undibacterium sp. TS12]
MTAASKTEQAEHVEPADSSEAIARDITTAIAEQRLPPGTKLREEALARMYSVSRTKIRAALVMLAKDKLIDLVPEKGAFVSKPGEQEAREIFFVRRILEAALVREFIAKARPEDYARLEEHLVRERQAIIDNNVQERSILLSDFHILLANTVGNQVLTDILMKLAGRSSLITMLYQSSRDASCSSDEHGEFLRAAKAGDVERAVELMEHHLHHVESALQFTEPAKADKKDFISALLA